MERAAVSVLNKKGGIHERARLGAGVERPMLYSRFSHVSPECVTFWSRAIFCHINDTDTGDASAFFIHVIKESPGAADLAGF